MTESTKAAVSTDESVATAPKFDFAMIALRSRIVLANPTANRDFANGDFVYVTRNDKNAIRAALSGIDRGFAVGDSVAFDHDTRKGSYGVLEIVGILNSDLTTVGFIPTGSLSLREIV